MAYKINIFYLSLLAGQACQSDREAVVAPAPSRGGAPVTPGNPTPQPANPQAPGPFQPANPQAPGPLQPANPQAPGPLQPAPGPLPMGPRTSGGAGGVAGLNEVTTAGLNYWVNYQMGTEAPGLLVLLHGSTASNYANFVGTMAQVAMEENLLPVSVLAPNQQGWNEGDQNSAAQSLHDLIQNEIYAKYDINLDRVFFSGQSSGGGFLASHFIPGFGSHYVGGAFLQCGASPPAMALNPQPDWLGKFFVHFEITTGDVGWQAQVNAAFTAYQTAMVPSTLSDSKPGGHCQFDQQEVIRGRLGSQ